MKHRKIVSILTIVFSLSSVTSYADLKEGYSWIRDQSNLLNYGNVDQDCPLLDSDYDVIYDYLEDNKKWNRNGYRAEVYPGKDISLEGKTLIYPFAKSERGFIGDTIAFYAIPKKEGNPLLDSGNIAVWSSNKDNQKHILDHYGLNGYYRCSKLLDLCYVALITKDGSYYPIGEYRADDVYLVFSEQSLTRWTLRHYPPSNSSSPDSDHFTCENVTNGFQESTGDWGGQCVPYVRKETGIEYACCNGYAKNCYDQARACGYTVGQSPKRGAVAVFNSWPGNRYGHVGIVIGIDSKNGRIQLRHSNWRLDERVSENWVSTKYLKGYVYPQGEGCAGPGGSTNPDPSDPPASGKLPDFITDKVTMAKENGKGERYTWKVNETAWVHAWVDNIGKANWEGKKDKIKVPFYLSKGTKEDRHSEWVRVGREEIKKKNVEVKDKPKHEKIAFNLPKWAAAGYIYPGRTYNFVVCADRPKDQDNGDGDVKEIHKSNNCSTEAVFYVDYGPARNVDVMASNLALAGGKSSLQAGEAYGFQADISNIGTEYPWNGCRTNYEIKGPGTGDVWQKVADEGSTVAQLGPNSTHVEVIDESRGLKAPSVGGDYVFRACADYEQTIPETDESNNCTAELPVTVTVPPPPAACVILNPLASLPATGSFDLAATSIEFPDVIQQGDEMHPKARLCGVSGTSPRTHASWLYANCDGTGLTRFDGDNDGGRSPGECITEEVITDEHKATMPIGRYVMYFIANGTSQIPESDYSNNVQAKEFVVE